jgi:5-oxoprolinase (ATP-hydrolysing)
LLDAGGELVVNAPHIPVHLGSLGLCVRAVRAVLDLRPGDVAVTNHPACGGSHLPDLTVVAPVYATAASSHDHAVKKGTSGHAVGGALLGYVAARAHHAELGGVRPGSMPPDARCLAEEGVVVPPTLIVAGGEPRFDHLREILVAPPYPTRNVADNLADLRAAVAACHQGAAALRALAGERGNDQVTRYMAALKRKAARRLSEALARLPDGYYAATEYLDDGTPLAVGITVTGDRARVDFAGSAPVHSGNFNATPAIVHSVVIYVLRLLVREELPLNEGLLEPVEIVIPPGILAPPFPDDPARAPSVVGGNVETSQRLVDTLIRALGLCAASQGTMNNVLFGDAQLSYYETVGGGCGAGEGFAGASAVHSHMTNTRITDPEVLELRYPVRVHRFALRRASGGAGRWSGGDGVVRELEFLAPLELSLLAQRRSSGPFGLAGGEPGAPGCQRLLRADGKEVALPGCVSIEVTAGDRLVLETPGGGGYGKARA